MSKTTKPVSAETAAPISIVPPPTSTAVRLFLPLGRGVRGKTLLSRWLIERAHEAGRTPVVADADRTNATLARFFDGVLSPDRADDPDVVALLPD